MKKNLVISIISFISLSNFLFSLEGDKGLIEQYREQLSQITKESQSYISLCDRFERITDTEKEKMQAWFDQTLSQVDRINQNVKALLSKEVNCKIERLEFSYCFGALSFLYNRPLREIAYCLKYKTNK